MRNRNRGEVPQPSHDGQNHIFTAIGLGLAGMAKKGIDLLPKNFGRVPKPGTPEFDQWVKDNDQTQ